MKLADLKALIAADLVPAWQERAEASDETLQGWIDHGIPIEYARLIASVFPSVPVSWWPKLLHPPRLQHGKKERSMSGSKMELQNERANRRVKTAATMTEQETPARKALLEAGVTPQDVAGALDVGRSTVNAWCVGSRSIPRRYADRLKAKYRIPTSVWAKISG